MATANQIFEWEGDNSQALANMEYTFTRFYQSKVRLSFARVIFTEGDLDDYQALVDARNDVIARNKAKIAEGSIDGAGGRVGGGFWFAEVPVAAADIETVPAVPVYAGDLALALYVYLNETLKSTLTVYNSKPFRLGVSERGTRWDFKLVGNIDKIHKFTAASSMRELKGEGEV